MTIFQKRAMVLFAPPGYAYGGIQSSSRPGVKRNFRLHTNYTCTE